MFIKKIGIDLGTTYTLVYIPKRGIVIHEPSVVAISVLDKKVMAVGDEAKEMIGRTPDSIIAARPLKSGVIADYKTTEIMLKYFINKAVGGMRIFRPEVMIAVPAGITSTERRAVIDATLNAGAKAAYIIKEPIAAAIGADIPIGSASGHMIVDMGLYSKPEIAKNLKGFVAKQLFRLVPWLKQQKFWGSGLWNPAYDIRSINDIDFYRRYLDKQKYSCKHQTMLSAY